MLNVISTNANRVKISSIGIVALLLVAYIDRPYDVNIFFRGEFWFMTFFIFAGLYILQSVLYLTLTEKHEGWRRISLVVGCAAGLIGGIIGYDGRQLDLNAFLLIFASVGLGLIVGFSVMLLWRWIRQGFSEPQ